MTKTIPCQKCGAAFPFTEPQQAFCQEYHGEPPTLCPHCRKALWEGSASGGPAPALRRHSRHGRGYFQRRGGYYGRR